jgi:tetratricopeptide (TPR) repeat protein
VAEELGDRASARNESGLGILAYQIGIDAMNTWRRRSPDDRAIEDLVRHLSTKQTILKGKYEKGETYRDSMADADEQADQQDKERTVQSADRLDELIEKAEKEFQDNPTDDRNLKNVVDMLCRRERNAEELRAVQLLVERYKESSNYRWKQMADDIRMRQLGREARELAKSGKPEAVKEHQIKQLRFELAVFKERVERYPTDNRMKFEYGTRTFRAGRFDDAIPLLQTARADPKNRTACGVYLGRCFLRKGYHSQAISTLRETIAGHEHTGDELSKSMFYWLGQALEGYGQPSEARETYGKILQVDYNYRDVRARLDALPK